jgi:hypothetical protein
MEIKAIKDMIVALTDVAVCAKSVLADGKVDLSDMGAFFLLVKNASDLTHALQETKDIPAEVKDLNQDEIVEIVQAILNAANIVKGVK